jgi:NADH:ubiquinone oxidoreductase subunit D
LWGFEELEKLMVFYERASGSRMHANCFRPGRVHQDLPSKLMDDIDAWCDPFLNVVDDLDGLLSPNRIFKARNVEIGRVSLQQAWACGFSGVMARGSGAAWDLRKAQPYDCYAELDFDIPIGKNGDCYDRYLIRMEEMHQSVRIMKQCIEKLRAPEGQGPVLVRQRTFGLGRSLVVDCRYRALGHFDRRVSPLLEAIGPERKTIFLWAKETSMSDYRYARRRHLRQRLMSSGTRSPRT